MSSAAPTPPVRTTAVLDRPNSQFRKRVERFGPVKRRVWLERAVEWLALNDDPAQFDLKAIQSTISVALVADLGAYTPEFIGALVLKERQRLASLG